jgi:GNAT superfamily N-acetyltransferase
VAMLFTLSIESKLYAPKVRDDRLERLSSLMMRRYKLKFGEAKNVNDFLKKYADKFFDIIDETYVDIYGSVPFTPGMRKLMISNFKLIVNLKNVAVIVDENDKVVCFGICFPSLASAIQKSKGHLTPLALIRLLKAIKNPKVLDLGLIGVLPEYRMKGIGSAILAQVMKMLTEGGIEYCETNLNLETNDAIINQWKSFEAVQHKRRRCYVKTI